MASVTNEGQGQGHLPSIVSSTASDPEVCRLDRVSSEASIKSENSPGSSGVAGSRRGRKLLNVVQGSPTNRSTARCRLEEPAPRGSTSGTEHGAASSGAEKQPVQSADRRENELVERAGVAGHVTRDGGIEPVTPPGRSRSQDRRMSMSVIDAVFRRRRRQSTIPAPQPQPQKSTDNMDQQSDVVFGTWRSETCRQLNELEAAETSSSTAERDQVDRQSRLFSGSWSWQQKMRRRIYDISAPRKPSQLGR